MVFLADHRRVGHEDDYFQIVVHLDVFDRNPDCVAFDCVPWIKSVTQRRMPEVVTIWSKMTCPVLGFLDYFVVQLVQHPVHPAEVECDAEVLAEHPNRSPAIGSGNARGLRRVRWLIIRDNF